MLQIGSTCLKQRERERSYRCVVFMLLLLLACGLGPNAGVFAKSAALKSGLTHYMRGEFSKAVPVLQKALKGTLSRSDKAKALKFLGLSLFTLGKLAEAEQSFIRCLDVDEACSIKKDEALDEAVLPFFKKVKDGENPGTAPSPEASLPAAVASPTPAAPSGSTSPGGEGGTRVIIQSNAPGASVLIDGILAGNAGAPVSVGEGTVEVEVVAKGFKSRQLKLAVSKGMLNTFQIDLAPEGTRDKEKERDKRELRDKERKSTASKKGRRGKEDSLDEAEVDLKDDFGMGSDEPVSLGRREPVETKPIPISFFHILPLGAGQFYNGDKLLGLGIAGVQAFTVYTIFTAEQNITTARNNLDGAIVRARTDSTFTQAALKDFTDETNSYIQNEQDTQTTYIFALAGAYAFGVVHAILKRPDAPQKNSSIEPAAKPFQWSLVRPSAKSYELVLDWKF